RRKCLRRHRQPPHHPDPLLRSAQSPDFGKAGGRGDQHRQPVPGRNRRQWYGSRAHHAGIGQRRGNHSRWTSFCEVSRMKTSKMPPTELYIVTDRPAFQNEVAKAVGEPEGISVKSLEAAARPSSLSACLAALDSNPTCVLLM